MIIIFVWSANIIVVKSIRYDVPYVLFLTFLGGLVLNIQSKLMCGGLAGAIAQSFSYPLDVTRRRMQLAMMNPETAKFG